MAVPFVWPVTLPQNPQEDYNESSGMMILRTPMESGPAKQRRRGAKPTVLSLNYLMTDVQVETFRSFVNDNLKGVKRFGLPHPRLLTEAEVRMVPSGEGDLFTTTYVGFDCWTVAFKVEILP